MAEQHFEVRLRRSGLGRMRTQRLTLAGLGLKHVGQSVFLRDTAPVRGMIYKVIHLVDVTPRVGQPPPSARRRAQLRAAAAPTA